ncbi:hypothetical protein D9M72_400550 [compost metagenome]
MPSKERTVNLEDVRRQHRQGAQRGISRPEVVDGHAHTGLLQGLECGDAAVRAASKGCFGDFEYHLFRLCRGVGKDARDGDQVPRVGQLDGGEVDGNPEVSAVRQGFPPAGRLAARVVQHPAADGVDVARLLGERNELRRRKQPQRGVLPAHQSLDAEDGSAVQIGNGLVLEAELAGGHGGGQVPFEGGAVRHMVVALGVEKLETCLSAVFGQIHREVRLPQQLGSVCGFRAPLCRAHAGRDGQPVVADEERRAQRPVDPIGDPGGDRAGVVVQHNDRELVSAEPGNHVVGADAALEAGGQLDEQGITPLMSQRIVDLLEVVDVDEQQPLVPVPAGASGPKGCREAFHQGRPVCQAGEGIVRRPVGKGLMAAVDGGGHAVECLRQFAEFVAAEDLDAVVVIACLQLADTLVQAPYRAHEVLDHPAAEVHRSAHCHHEQEAARDNQEPLEFGAVRESLVHFCQGVAPDVRQLAADSCAGGGQCRGLLHVAAPQ